ncbi:MAG: TVP38/TMEM64 family protein [Pseudomonadota bacterium]
MTQTSSDAPSKGKFFKQWGPLVVVIVLLAAGYFAGVQEHLSLSNLIEQRARINEFVSDNLLLAIAAYMLIYIVLVAVSFPGGLALSITSGLIFGWLIAGVATVTAATIGAIIIFLIARSSFGSILKERAGGFMTKMMEGFQKDAFQYLLTLRLVPAFPFWAVNIVPGLLNMKLAPYALATFIGIIPGTFAFTYLGAGLDSVIENQGCEPGQPCSIDPGALVTTELILALAFLAALSFIPFIVKKLRGDKQPVE